MTEFTLTTTVDDAYEDTVERVKELLGEAGFGVLTEIDLRATLKAKLGVDVPPEVILGACRPQLAHQALEADPRIAVMLPCNVVVASEGPSRTRVDVLDPRAMTSFTDAAGLDAVASEARERLAGMLAALAGAEEGVTGAARV